MAQRVRARDYAFGPSHEGEYTRSRTIVLDQKWVERAQMNSASATKYKPKKLEQKFNSMRTKSRNTTFLFADVCR